jgi:hypothetical protein
MHVYSSQRTTELVNTNNGSIKERQDWPGRHLIPSETLQILQTNSTQTGPRVRRLIVLTTIGKAWRQNHSSCTILGTVLSKSMDRLFPDDTFRALRPNIIMLELVVQRIASLLPTPK